MFIIEDYRRNNSKKVKYKIFLLYGNWIILSLKHKWSKWKNRKQIFELMYMWERKMEWRYLVLKGCQRKSQSDAAVTHTEKLVSKLHVIFYFDCTADCCCFVCTGYTKWLQICVVHHCSVRLVLRFLSVIMTHCAYWVRKSATKRRLYNAFHGEKNLNFFEWIPRTLSYRPHTHRKMKREWNVTKSRLVA